MATVETGLTIDWYGANGFLEMARGAGLFLYEFGLRHWLRNLRWWLRILAWAQCGSAGSGGWNLFLRLLLFSTVFGDFADPHPLARADGSDGIDFCRGSLGDGNC